MRRQLEDFRPGHDFFVGIDSDGCVFPTMARKQCECFHPAIMDHWGLWPLEEHLRRVAEWVNLESAWRGSNRFPALKMVLDLFRRLPAVRASGMAVRGTDDLGAFIAGGRPLHEESLADWVETECPSLADVLAWSRDVSRRVAVLVGAVAPFAGAREALVGLAGRADLVVISATPAEALGREWRAARLAGLVSCIAGQEDGDKAAQLRRATAGRYRPDHVLMVGDALGDLAAARSVGALFYPVMPGEEEASWARLAGADGAFFFSGGYAGDLQARLEVAFRRRLPERPPFPVDLS